MNYKHNTTNDKIQKQKNQHYMYKHDNVRRREGTVLQWRDSLVISVLD